MSRPEKVYVLCPECDGNGYFTPEKDKFVGKDKVLDTCNYCEGTGHVGWKRTFEGSYGDKHD